MITVIQICGCLLAVSLAFLALGIGFYWCAQGFAVFTDASTKGEEENDDDDDDEGDQGEEKPPHMRGPDWWKKGRR